jgi:hypothetical protein
VNGEPLERSCRRYFRIAHSAMNRPYEDEPGVIEQFRPGERQARFDAEWDPEQEDWIFGKRVDDA